MRRRIGALPPHIVVDFPEHSAGLHCTACGVKTILQMETAADAAPGPYNAWRRAFVAEHEKCNPEDS